MFRDRTKDALAIVLSRFNLELRRTSVAPGRESIGGLLRQARSNGLLAKTIIDIGVGRGTKGLYGIVPGAEYLLIEPVAEFEPFLKQLCGRFDRASYEVVAAGASEGSIELAMSGGLTGTSGFVPSESGERRVVPMKPLDHIVHAHQKPGPYVIKIDTQGAELSILEGAEKTLTETSLLILEASVRSQGSEPEFGAIHSYLQKREFVLYDIFNQQYSPRTGRLGQVDVAFVSRDSVLRVPGPFRTNAQRVANSRRKANALNSGRLEF